MLNDDQRQSLTFASDPTYSQAPSRASSQRLEGSRFKCLIEDLIAEHEKVLSRLSVRHAEPHHKPNSPSVCWKAAPHAGTTSTSLSPSHDHPSPGGGEGLRFEEKSLKQSGKDGKAGGEKDKESDSGSDFSFHGFATPPQVFGSEEEREFLESLSSPERNWLNLTKAILEVHSSDMYAIRDCWQSAHRVRLSVSNSGGQAGFGMEFIAIQPQGQDIVESLWRKAKGVFGRNSSRLHFSPKRRSLMTHPDAFERLLWAMVGLLFLVMDLFFATMSIFGVDRPLGVALADCLYWSVDVLFNFVTGYHEHDKVVLNPKLAAKKYLRTWFPFDISLTCSAWVLLLLEEEGAGANMFRYFRLVRLTRLFRLSKFSTSIRQLILRVQAQWASLALKMVGYMLSVALWIHMSASAYYWIGDRPGGWTRDNEAFQTPPLNYIVSVHWAASQLQGGIDVYPAFTVEERAFAVLNLLASVGVLAMVVSKVTTILHAMQMANAERHRMFTTARRFVEGNGIRPELALEVYRYLTIRQRLQVREGEDADERELLHRLPIQLKRRLLEEARWPFLGKQLIFSAFASCSSQFKKQLICDVVQSVVHLPDDLVFQYGTICSRMYVTVTPDGQYTRYAKLFANLLSGAQPTTIGTGLGMARVESAAPDDEVKSGSTPDDTFREIEDRHRQLQGCSVRQATSICEVALWTQWAHVGDLEAVGELELFSINIHSFIELVGTFPSVQKGLRTHANRFIQYLRVCEELSDLLSTDQVMAHEMQSKRPLGSRLSAAWIRGSGGRASVQIQAPEVEEVVEASPSLLSAEPQSSKEHEQIHLTHPLELDTSEFQQTGRCGPDMEFWWDIPHHETPTRRYV